jgi:hypothetical protein
VSVDGLDITSGALLHIIAVYLFVFDFSDFMGYARVVQSRRMINNNALS